MWEGGGGSYSKCLCQHPACYLIRGSILLSLYWPAVGAVSSVGLGRELGVGTRLVLVGESLVVSIVVADVKVDSWISDVDAVVDADGEDSDDGDDDVEIVVFITVLSLSSSSAAIFDVQCMFKCFIAFPSFSSFKLKS